MIYMIYMIYVYWLKNVSVYKYNYLTKKLFLLLKKTIRVKEIKFWISLTRILLSELLLLFTACI